MKTRRLFLFVALLATVVFAALPGNVPYYNAALSNTAVRVSATPAYLVGYNIANTNSSPVYVQFFNANATGNVTVGTTSPTIGSRDPWQQRVGRTPSWKRDSFLDRDRYRCHNHCHWFNSTFYRS